MVDIVDVAERKPEEALLTAKVIGMALAHNYLWSERSQCYQRIVPAGIEKFTVVAMLNIAEHLGFERLDLALRIGRSHFAIDRKPHRTQDATA